VIVQQMHMQYLYLPTFLLRITQYSVSRPLIASFFLCCSGTLEVEVRGHVTNLVGAGNFLGEVEFLSVPTPLMNTIIFKTSLTSCEYHDSINILRKPLVFVCDEFDECYRWRS